MPVCDNTLLKPEIIVMEDSPDVQEAIKQVMEDELKWKVKIVEKGADAVSLAEQKEAGYYILDVHMGKNREQEGLNALEEIKQINNQAFVSIFSAYPVNRKLAENLNADVFVEKTPNLKDNIFHELASQILEYRLKYLRDCEEETFSQLQKINQDLEPDQNLKAYNKLKSDQKWLEKYEGKYVAFIDGELVDSDEQEQKLLERLWEKFPDKSSFLTKVREKTRTIDIPYFDIV